MSIPDYRILFADTYVEQLLGYSSEELRQSNIGILCGPRTNVAMLKSCTMEGEMVSIQYPAQLILYNRQLEPKRINGPYQINWTCLLRQLLPLANILKIGGCFVERLSAKQ